MSLKFRTVVVILVIFLVSPLANASDDNDDNTSGNSFRCSSTGRDRASENLTKAEASKDTAAIQLAQKAYTREQTVYEDCQKRASHQTSGCDSAVKDYSDDLKEMRNYWGAIGGKPTSATDPVKTFQKCDLNNINGHPAVASSGTDGVPNAEALAQQYQVCPVLASEDLQKMKDELDKHKKARDALTDKQADQNKDTNATKKDTAKQIADLNKQIRQENADFANQMNELSKQQAQDRKELQSQMTQIQEKITENGDKQNQTNTDRKQAMADLNAAKADIENTCLQQAGLIISKMQEKVVALMTNKLYNRGGGTDVFKVKGLTDEMYWQLKMHRLVVKCQNSPETALKMKRANDIYAVNVSKIEDQAESARKQGALLTQQMYQLKDNLPCTVSTSEACNEARQAQADRDTKTTAHETALQGIRSDIRQAQIDGMQNDDQKVQSTKLTNDISLEDKNIQNLNDVLNAKYAAGATGSDDDKNASKSQAKFHEAITDGLQVLQCAKDAKTPPTCDSSCQQVAHFLRNAVAYDDDKNRFHSLAQDLNIPLDDNSTTIRAPSSGASSSSGAATSSEGSK